MTKIRGGSTICGNVESCQSEAVCKPVLVFSFACLLQSLISTILKITTVPPSALGLSISRGVGTERDVAIFLLILPRRSRRLTVHLGKEPLQVHVGLRPRHSAQIHAESQQNNRRDDHGGCSPRPLDVVHKPHEGSERSYDQRRLAGWFAANHVALVARWVDE